MPAEYIPDLGTNEGEPWLDENHPVDQLISLQEKVFAAEHLGDKRQLGTLFMSMSRVEHDIANHGEAAAYASDAAEAFEAAGIVSGAIAANATVAREYRTLYSPDLALAFLQNVISLSVGKSNELSTEPNINRLDINSLPILCLLADFASTFSRGIFGDWYSSNMFNPKIEYRKYPKQSRSSSQEFNQSISEFLELPMYLTRSEACSVFRALGWIYAEMIYDRSHFKLKGDIKTEAKFLTSKLFDFSSVLEFGQDTERKREILGEGDETLRSVLSKRLSLRC